MAVQSYRSHWDPRPTRVGQPELSQTLPPPHQAGSQKSSYSLEVIRLKVIPPKFKSAEASITDQFQILEGSHCDPLP